MNMINKNYEKFIPDMLFKLINIFKYNLYAPIPNPDTYLMKSLNLCSSYEVYIPHLLTVISKAIPLISYRVSEGN